MNKIIYCTGSVVLPFGKAEDAKEASRITREKYTLFNSQKNIFGLPLNPNMNHNHLLSPRIEIDKTNELCLVTSSGNYINYPRHCLILPISGDINSCRIPFNLIVVIAGKIPAFVADDIKEGKSISRIQNHPTELNYGYYSGKLLFLRNLKDCL